MSVQLSTEKERPILMSAPMVRATLDGRKTHTRRIMKMTAIASESIGKATSRGSRFERYDGGSGADPGHFRIFTASDVAYNAWCPYGEPGDRLWVRETWQTPWMGATQMFPASPEAVALHKSGARAVYAASWSGPRPRRWRPSTHMPRWASRLTLEITDVRVRRLQEISEEDARAEGARHFPDLPGPDPYGTAPRWSMESPPSTEDCLGSAQMAFANLWIKLHGRDSWDANPWVWAISFRRLFHLK